MASIRKREWPTKSGETRTAWMADYIDQKGKRHIKTFAKQRDAKDWLVTAQGEVQQGTHTADSESITVKQAGALWLDRGRLDKRERSTLAERESHMRLHINPALGAVKLSRLTTPAIEAFGDDLLRKNSRAMARKILVSLKGILNDAQRRGLIAQNVARPVKIEIDRREAGKLRVGRDIPSKDEVQAILAHARGRWRPIFVTAIFTGMRASELRGLTWEDVDFKRKVISVRQRANRWCEIGSPKSEAGHRDMPLAPMVVNTLKEWRLACPNGPLNLVFPNGAGNVENHGNILGRGFYTLQLAAGIAVPAVDKKGRPVMKPRRDQHGKPVLGRDGKPVMAQAMVPKYGLHALRHFAASWFIEQEFTPKRLQELLGHRSIKMTFDVYGHLFPSLEDDHAKLAAGERALLAT